VTTSILGIETATDICSVALSIDHTIIAEETLSTGLRHSSALTELIQSVLSKGAITVQQLSAIAISNGPGSYTGLRVGASTAKGMCYAFDIPLIAVPTLEALGLEAKADRGQYVLSTIDARRMEAYALITKEGEGVIKDTHAIIWSKEVMAALAEAYDDLIICGTGIEKGIELIEPYDWVKSHISTCAARHIMPIALRKYDLKDFADIAYHDPFYYKSPNITQSKKRILQ